MKKKNLVLNNTLKKLEISAVIFQYSVKFYFPH